MGMSDATGRKALSSASVAAPGAEAGAGGNDALTDLEFGAGANRVNDSDALKASKVGQLGQLAVGSRNDIEVSGVDGRRLKLDGHLAGGGGSSRHVNLGERRAPISELRDSNPLTARRGKRTGKKGASA